MKRTEITYKEIGNDQVEILDIQNVATQADIQKEFGTRIQKEYVSDAPLFTKMSSRGIWIRHDKQRSAVFEIKIGDEMSKVHFQKIITTMKTAGQRLVDIRKEHAKPKTILI